MSITIGYDATHANVSSLPRGAQVAGYVTGSPDIVWTAADWNAHPGALRIDQSPVNTPADETADILDFESGAANVGDIGPWTAAAMANWRKATRPGQRTPAIYGSLSVIPTIVGALKAAKLTNVGIFLANWNLSLAAAETDLGTLFGGYPVVGVQFSSGATYDHDAFDSAWLKNVSKVGVALPEVEYQGILLYSRPGIPTPVANLGYARVQTRDGKTWAEY